MAKILYAKNQEMCDDMLQRRLRRKGFECIRVFDGEEVVKSAHSEQPDLILISMDLPVKDTWTAIKEIKAAEDTRSIPIIALVAYSMSDERNQALAAGCDDFDTRPVELPRLLVKINHLLSNVINC